jgi:chromosome segregation ATPase
MIDERKKAMREYEDKKREVLNSIEGILEKLGASLLPRLEQDDTSEYSRLTRDISDSEVYITAIEGDIARLKTLEEEIQQKDQENIARAKDISKLFTRLGEAVLEEGDCIDAVKPFQGQAETLYSKIKSLEERLDQLEEGGNRNVLVWIGKNTQGMVLRSFLGKSRSSLQKIYTQAGEKYFQSVSSDSGPGITSLSEEIGILKQESMVVSADLTRLREERRRISETFGPDGGPVKKIQSLERHIAHSREELRGLFLRYGREVEAAGIEESDETAVPPMDEADSRLLENIRQGREAIRVYDREIEKLKASLAIDEEKAAIAKIEKSIKDHEARIQASEKTIINLNQQIEEANARIEELTRIL